LAGERDLRASLGAEQREMARRQQEAEEVEAARALAHKATLGALWALNCSTTQVMSLRRFFLAIGVA